MNFGYARVSTKEQNEMRQVDALRAAGIDERNIVIDRQSGKDFDRAGFLSLVGSETTSPRLRAGDVLYILSIDRLGRDYTETGKWWQFITHELSCDIVVLDMPLLDTRQQDGNSLDRRFVADLVLQILSYVAQKERENIRQRQGEGYESMKRHGTTIDCVSKAGKKFVSARTNRPVGRPVVEYPSNWEEVYTMWKAKEITAVEAMYRLNLKKNSFYNLVKRMESGK